MSDKNFRGFVRSTVALAFLPINQIEAAIDELRDTDFDQKSVNYEKMLQFRDAFLDYIEEVWINGHFAPKLWNQGKKAKDTTNNNNEG